MSQEASIVGSVLRVRIFVDFWNFSLSLRSEENGFFVDWRPLGELLAKEAAEIVNKGASFSYEAMHVYGSYDRTKPNDTKFRNWFTGTLDQMPGVHAVILERQKKRGFPKCPACQSQIETCPSCNADMRGTEEKGVDTRIVTDMISLAWANAYDIAVLVSSDRDFVPVAEFLQTKGIKVIHGAFPPLGCQLSQKCWASINLAKMKDKYRRK